MTSENPAGTSPVGAVALVAFTGWNDAGNAASEALCHLEEVWGARELERISAEEYVDFQMNRPVLTDDPSGERSIEWPDIRINRVGHGEEPPVLTVMGPEPSLHWRAFCTELLDRLADHGVTTVVTLGALLADAPHTRPLPITATWRGSQRTAVSATEESSYEGPVGIPTILNAAAVERGLEALSLWVQVPNYVGQGPAPKATLTLVTSLERELDLVIQLGDLEEDAHAWVRGLDELADTEPDVAAYISQLEEVRDTADLPEASGDAIADEFEQFLRRRGQQ